VLPRLDPVAPRPSGVDLKHPSGRTANAARGVVEGWSIFDDADNQAVVVDEKQIEGNAGVVHPELMVVPKSEVEEHSAVFG